MGLIAVGATGLSAPLSLLIAVGGFVTLLSGLLVGRREPLTLGALGIFAAAVLAGWAGAPLSSTVLAVTAAILAWDLGQFAIGIGEQLGRDAETVRLELVHAAASTAVGIAALVAGSVVFSFAGGSTPTSALFVLVVAVAVVVLGLRRMRPRAASGG
jgi:hypothetical protein